MPHESRIEAGIEIIPLCDAVGPMGAAIRKPLPEMFRGASFPADAEWVLHFHCYLLLAAGRTILVDTGVGGADSPAASWAPVPGRLVAEMAAAGVKPADVDAVVITHLHSDHAGGCVAGGAPVFANARHLIQRAELDWVSRPMREQVVAPLGDRVEAVSGDVEPFPGVRLLHTPGHTPGHQCVAVGDLVLSGDVLHHPVQLGDPTITYVYDEDPAEAVRSRKAVLSRARVLATAHFAEPFTSLSS